MNTEDAPTILIIDNDDGVVRAMATRLESLGYACVTAGSGAQGVSTFRDLHADLVITDLNMPGGDGVSVAESIRKTSAVPIIIVTGFRPDFDDRLRGIPDVTVLEKPFDSMALVDLVELELALAERPG